MSRPTDGELNEAMAAVIWGCSHSDVTRHNARGLIICRRCGAEMEKYPFWPKFCSDWNTLPAVWCALEAAGATDAYFSALWNVILGHVKRSPHSREWIVETAETRWRVEAALRALSLWKPEWSEEDGGEQ